MTPLAEPAAYVPAAAFDATVAAVQFELAVLEATLTRATSEVSEAERVVVPTPAGIEGTPVLRVLSLLDQHAAAAEERQQARLEEAREEGRAVIDRAREEAELILLGIPRPARTAATSTARAGGMPSDAVTDEDAELVRRLLGQVAVPPQALRAPPEVAAVPASDADPDRAGDQQVPVGEAPEVFAIDEDTEEADERFRQFWEPASGDVELPSRSWSDPATMVFPVAVFTVVLSAFLVWIS